MKTLKSKRLWFFSASIWIIYTILIKVHTYKKLSFKYSWNGQVCRWYISVHISQNFIWYIKSLQIVYFTAIAPYVLLMIIFIRGVTLNGAGNGLIYYLKPDFSRLTDGQVWMDGGTQVIYSIGVGQGFMITLGSYNKFKTNCLRYCIMETCIVNCSIKDEIMKLRRHYARQLKLFIHCLYVTKSDQSLPHLRAVWSWSILLFSSW